MTTITIPATLLTYTLKDTRGRGYLTKTANTAFDLPGNWTIARKARTFPDFATASAHAQAFHRAGAVEIVEASSS